MTGVARGDQVELVTRMPGSPRWVGTILDNPNDDARVWVAWEDGALSSVRIQFLVPASRSVLRIPPLAARRLLRAIHNLASTRTPQENP